MSWELRTVGTDSFWQFNGTDGNDVEFNVDDGSSDFMYGNNGHDELHGQSGNDSLFGGHGNDTLYGGSDDDFLVGETDHDWLYGGSGDDTLIGGNGNDRLDGYSTSGVEYDILNGGWGYDTFVLGGYWGVSYEGNGYAIIEDYNQDDDTVELTGDISDYSLGYLNPGNISNVGGVNSPSDTVLSYKGDWIAIFADTTAVDLSSFTFV